MVKQKEVLTINQCEQFIQSAKTIQEKLMIEMMLMCGLRLCVFGSEATQIII